MEAFIIWEFMGAVFICLGIYSFLTKKTKATGFWANAKMFPVKDIKAYNKAMGKLWCAYGIIFMLLGLPILKEQNTPYIILSILGVAFETITIMTIYTTIIEPRHRKK